MLPSVDIVLCTNRSSPYLREALDAVQAQTYTHWRLIVVDDGSPDGAFLTDATRGISNCTVLRRPPSGLSRSRNAGIESGSSPFIAFLDDDDVWSPRKLELQVAALDSAQGCLASYTAGWYMHGDGTPFAGDEGWDARQTPSEDFLAGIAPTPRIVSLILRRDAWKAVGGFDPSYRISEDNHFILRLVQYGEMACVPQRLVGYRRHSGNVSQPGALAARRESRRMLCELIAHAEQRNDAKSRDLLRLKLEGSRQEWADEFARGLFAAMRDRDVQRVWAELLWGARQDPALGIRAGLSKLRVRLNNK